jgi:hypothetical protein
VPKAIVLGTPKVFLFPFFHEDNQLYFSAPIFMFMKEGIAKKYQQ